MSPRPRTENPRSRLETVLIRHGLSIRSLCAELGTTYAVLWRVVAGREQMTRPRAQRVAKALAALGASVEWHEIM